jgi:dTDP-4-amino-4,6-dideoxygalactose transaminase
MVTNSLCSSVISLPIHTELSKDALKYITSSLVAFF